MRIVAGSSRGKQFTDRKLSGEVRGKALKQLRRILNTMERKKVEEFTDFERDVLLRLSPSLLPRLNAGRDEDERLIPEPIYGGKSTKK